MASFDDLDTRFAPWARWLYQMAEYHRLRPRLTSTYRSVAHQERLYREYLAGKRTYPVARPGCSQHNYGLAIDMVSDDNKALGVLWRSVGGSWGGDRDPVHFGVPWYPCR